MFFFLSFSLIHTVLTYDDMLDEDGEGSLPSYGTPPHSIHANRSKNARNAGVQQSNQHSSTTNGELPIVGMVKPALTKQDTVECDAKVPDGKGKIRKIKELSEEEKIQIILSDSFRDFFDQAVRITQRAIDLLEPNDLFTNYSGYSNNLESDEKKSTKLSFNRVFCDDVWSKNRTVTCLDWSDQYPELLLASYSENKLCPNEPDGVCLVWNMKFKKKSPEYIFHCQSPVMSACFAKFNPNLIIGGTYSGQIVLWDNRSHKKTPVQRSPLSAAAHTHPIYCIQVIGTQNAHNLISISTDGKLCSWSLDMLSTPQESIELNQQKQSKPVNVTAMSFPPDDFNNFLIGSEDGIVYGASRHGNKQGVTELYEGHHAPVTRVHCNPITSPIDFSHLFLSSSFDWTVKLWSVKETKPLYSFEDNNDYVFDVKWSPIHPALFATVDITGRIDLWNLNNDTELPTASTVVEGNTALNKLVWSPSGNQLYAGDHEGKIWIYDVGEQLALPRSDEATQLIHTLTELKSNNLEVNDESDYGFSSMTNTMTSLTSLPSAVLR